MKENLKEIIDRRDFKELDDYLRQEKSKGFIIDLADIPANDTWTIDTWKYYFEGMGVCFINSKDEREIRKIS